MPTKVRFPKHDYPVNSAIRYHYVYNNIIISARIPQKLVKRDGTINRHIINLLRQPCFNNKMKLMIKYGVSVIYKYMNSTSNTLEHKHEYKEAA